MPKTYRVSGEHVVLGHKPGETFKGPLPAGINEEALLASGAIEPDTGESKDEEERIVCPACKAEGKKRAVTFATQEELEAHYADKHPALEAPEKEE